VDAVVKYQKPLSNEEKHRLHVEAMYLLFLLQNADSKPDLDGSFYLGDISNPAEKNWTKVTPYSLAQPKGNQ
jgi:hypothetical protein